MLIQLVVKHISSEASNSNDKKHRVEQCTSVYSSGPVIVNPLEADTKDHVTLCQTSL